MSYGLIPTGFIDHGISMNYRPGNGRSRTVWNESRGGRDELEVGGSCAEWAVLVCVTGVIMGKPF